MDFENLRLWIRQFKDKGLNRIYCHWSAGHYTTLEPAYHIIIDGDGKIYAMNSLDKTLAATWRRNTNSINVSMMCCPDAVAYSDTSVDFGSEPPKDIQITNMAKIICIICEELDIPLDKTSVFTHAEIADIDGYGIHGTDPDMRWDLLLLKDPADGNLKPGGDVVRGLAIWFHYHPDSI